MHVGSQLILTGFLLLVALLFASMMGPVGLLALPILLILAGFVLLATGSETVARPANCADCGAPNQPDADECGYCGEPL